MKLNTTSLVRLFTTCPPVKPKICVVGSGPAGFYAAQYMANRLQTAEIDIFERLPVPFGLVRFGVAPDHANLKKCINSFTKIAQFPNVRFMGNINVGKDVTIKQLKETYHVILLTYGVDDSKKLDVKGSDLKNIFQAKNFVGWYNGVPWDKNLPVDLTGSTATIFGHGNVAIDVARILLSSIDKLKNTDITEHSLATLSQSRIKEVCLIGRRGPLQVSFTIKELRELLNLQNCCTVWRPEDMEGVAEIVPQLVKPRKRLTELLVEKFKNRTTPQSDDKLLRMIFQRSPKEFGGNVAVEYVKLNINKLEGDDLLNQRAVLTEAEETLNTDIVVNSIGYKSVQVDEGIPFDFDKGVIINQFGRVEDGLYAAGWVAKGASGVLLHTMEHAFGVGGIIMKDIENTGLVRSNKSGFEGIKKILEEKRVQIVTWADWLKIDEFEKREGQTINKPREKVVDIAQMLKIAAS